MAKKSLTELKAIKKTLIKQHNTLGKQVAKLRKLLEKVEMDIKNTQKSIHTIELGTSNFTYYKGKPRVFKSKE